MKKKLNVTKILSYRIFMEVNRLFTDAQGNTFPLCPRCANIIDREFMNYCSCCGQHLAWNNVVINNSWKLDIS